MRRITVVVALVLVGLPAGSSAEPTTPEATETRLRFGTITFGYRSTLRTYGNGLSTCYFEDRGECHPEGGGRIRGPVLTASGGVSDGRHAWSIDASVMQTGSSEATDEWAYFMLGIDGCVGRPPVRGWRGRGCFGLRWIADKCDDCGSGWSHHYVGPSVGIAGGYEFDRWFLEGQFDAMKPVGTADYRPGLFESPTLVTFTMMIGVVLR